MVQRPERQDEMVRVRRALLSRSWLFAIAFALFAYSFHRVGSVNRWYSQYWWYQIIAHYLSAAGVAVLLARFGLDMGLRQRRLTAFVVAFTAIGAAGWEVIEYFALLPALHFWGVEDMLLDMVANAAGLLTVLALLRTRMRPVIDPTQETPSVSTLVFGEP